MKTILSSKTSHLELIKVLVETKDYNLLAIKRGGDQVGFALVTKVNSIVTIGTEKFNQINIDSVRVYNINDFKALKVFHGTTENLQEFMLDLLINDK
tara:strand:+ start:140 stop:430 length:291 start_codon:yes stop_codon:yes gene_type:complete